MKKTWEAIGFDPSRFNLIIAEDDETVTDTADVVIKSSATFTPPSKHNPEKNDKSNNLKGVVIKNLPEKIPDEEIEAFLHSKGLKPSEGKITIKRNKNNTAADVEDINNETSKELIENLHEKIFFNKKVYCRGLLTLETPPKEKTQPEAKETKTPEKSLPKIPGLAKEEIKKAEKKSKEKKKKTEKKNKVEMKTVEKNKPEYFPKHNLNEFVFEESISESENETPTTNGSFFTKSPFLAREHELIQNEELRKTNENKRLHSPADPNERRIRSRSTSSVPNQQ